MTTPLLINVQRYCIHDGDGIRSTVFFKGCPMRCRWCHNPESQSFEPQTLVRRGERELVGKPVEVDELFRQLMRDEPFYEESGGGVTLSGGEAAAQDPDYLEALLRKLRRRGVRVNLDTCGHVPFERLERLLPYLDTFLYDVKLLDSALHREWTGVDNALILSNLARLWRRGAGIWARVPVIGGVNADEASMRDIAVFLRENAPLGRIHLLPYHNTGSGKYEQLGRPYADGMSRPDDETMRRLADVFTGLGFPDVRIGG